MIKNQFLLLIIVTICAITIANIGAFIYAIVMLSNEGSNILGFISIICIGIGYFVGRSVAFILSYGNIEKLELQVTADTGNETTSFRSVYYGGLIAAVVSAYGVLLGDVLHFSWMEVVVDSDRDGFPITEPFDLFIHYPVIGYIFIYPFQHFFDAIGEAFNMLIFYFTYLSDDFLYSIISLLFLGCAAYWSAITVPSHYFKSR